MSRKRRSAVQRYHDRVAGCYDQTYDDDFWKWHDALTWDYLKPFLPRDQSAKIIDLGCGTGKWGARIARSGYHVTSVDISAQMLDQAREKIRTRPSSPPPVFVQADLCDLSALRGEEFALAVALGDPVGCTPSPRKALKEIRRLLAPDGVLVATFDNRLSALEFYLADGDPKAVARFLSQGRTHWLTQNAAEQFPIFTYAPSDVRRLIEACGFEMLELVGKTVLPLRHQRHLLATAEARRAWARIEKGLSRNPDAVGRATHLQVACRVTHRRHCP